MVDLNIPKHLDQGVNPLTAFKTAQVPVDQLKVELDKHVGSINTDTGIKLLSINFGSENEPSSENSDQSEMTDEEFESVQDWIDPDISLKEGQNLLGAAKQAVVDWAVAQAAAEETQEVSEKKSETLIKGYPFFLWAKDNRDVFQVMMDAGKLNVRSHASFGMKVFRYIEKCSGKEVHRGTLSRFGSVSEYASDLGKTADNFSAFLDEEDGWTNVYKIASQKQNEQGNKRRKEQMALNNSWLSEIHTTAPEIAKAAIGRERKKGVQEHFGGLEGSLVLMVGRIDQKSIQIIGRLDVEEQKAKQIILTNGIHQYGTPAQAGAEDV
ncbi:hypothetical protein [Terasakiella pusilla]|uniref:hypothetical protein n=1 Tax=Terasakiella pusilla TaxID=64973 RepID=UPI0004902983|nr:hypothetical protein [Terasakiella pusilla]